MARYDGENDVVVIEGVSFTEGDYFDICMRADYCGMSALTEQEQYLLDIWHNRENLEAA